MCGLKSSKEKHEPKMTEYDSILQAIHIFCTDHYMQAVDRSFQHDCKTGKWSVKLNSLADGSIYHLEMFVHTANNCNIISRKNLYGMNLMAYEEMCSLDDVIGFFYKSEGNLEEFMQNNTSISDEVIGHIFVDIVAAVIELHRMRKVHLQLNWENVFVVKDNQANTYHGKLSALEYVIRQRNLDAKRLAPLAHRPPELINWSFLTQINLCKAQTYILGSQLFTLFTGKYMGGESFNPLEEKQKAGRTYDNIKKNTAQLDNVLSESSLSSKFQNLFKQMLEIYPDQRLCLNHVYSVLSSWKFFSSSVAGPCLCPKYAPGPSGESATVLRSPVQLTDSQIDKLSIMTDDLSVEEENPVYHIRKSSRNEVFVEVVAASTQTSDWLIAATSDDNPRSYKKDERKVYTVQPQFKEFSKARSPKINKDERKVYTVQPQFKEFSKARSTKINKDERDDISHYNIQIDIYSSSSEESFNK